MAWQLVTWVIEAPKKRGPHQPHIYKCLGAAFPVCLRCGLMMYNNQITRKLINLGCDG